MQNSENLPISSRRTPPTGGQTSEKGILEHKSSANTPNTATSLRKSLAQRIFSPSIKALIWQGMPAAGKIPLMGSDVLLTWCREAQPGVTVPQVNAEKHRARSTHAILPAHGHGCCCQSHSAHLHCAAPQHRGCRSERDYALPGTKIMKSPEENCGRGFLLFHRDHEWRMKSLGEL